MSTAAIISVAAAFAAVAVGAFLAIAAALQRADRASDEASEAHAGHRGAVLALMEAKIDARNRQIILEGSAAELRREIAALQQARDVLAARVATVEAQRDDLLDAIGKAPGADLHAVLRGELARLRALSEAPAAPAGGGAGGGASGGVPDSAFRSPP